jgi:hypothetical protein
MLLGSAAPDAIMRHFNPTGSIKESEREAAPFGREKFERMAIA